MKLIASDLIDEGSAFRQSGNGAAKLEEALEGIPDIKIDLAVIVPDGIYKNDFPDDGAFHGDFLQMVHIEDLADG